MIFLFNKASKKKSQNNKIKSKSHNVIELLKLSLPYKNKFLLACICVIIINGIVLLKPVILKVVIDDFLMGGKAQKGLYSVTAFAVLYLTVSILGSFLSYSQTNLVNKASQSIIKDLRLKVFRIIHFLPLTHLDKTSSGRLITRATNDISEISDMYTDVLINLLNDIFLLIGIIYAMLSMDPELTLVSFTVIPLMVFVVLFIKNRVRKNFFTIKHIIGKINGFMAENISGMKVIQIFRAEKEKEEEFEKLNEEYFRSTILQVRLHSFLRPISDVFQNVSTAILIWYGMNQITGHNLQIGVLFAFTTYIKQFFNPISDLADKYNSIQSALVSAERIFELLKQEDSLEDLNKGKEIRDIKGSIEFRNVWFSYDGKNWILNDVSFKVEKGQSIAFVGETGAGKTTIISLICGFYKIQKGEILIDGVNINDIRLSNLRKSIAAVLQDVFLFSGTIKDNIVLNETINERDLHDAINVSCADTIINSFDQGIDEPVMERGSTLSSGQRQLISFARAVAHNPSIFILDEATSNIDTHTEALIQNAISNIMKDRTTIVIAHRLSTIKNSDIIIVMKDGRIAELGNHKSLLLKNGYYAQLLNERKVAETKEKTAE